MNTKFKIELFDETEVERLPIHYKTIEYFEKFVAENILSEFKIILNTKWIHSFGIFFDSADYKNIPEHLKSFDGIEKYLVILPPNTFSKESIKSYSVQFFASKIKDNPKGEFIGFCEMMLDYIETFFVMNYKKVKETDFINIRQNVDWEYLKSIKYPADLKDQHFVGK
ncbi:hypothetical protein Q2T41_18115 [Maribacter confluentis]|uniref:Uncharacterized protein n=1 Tax=Maribacter confluentis TaxID=1656093 RepID=A0ABT8RVV8_9FLAO|nr:hypothetical protein [Maribacter confluentis]MDO1514574.1 hypothetical protein [Maribacter confluentis]